MFGEVIKDNPNVAKEVEMSKLFRCYDIVTIPTTVIFGLHFVVIRFNL